MIPIKYEQSELEVVEGSFFFFPSSWGSVCVWTNPHPFSSAKCARELATLNYKPPSPRKGVTLAHAGAVASSGHEQRSKGGGGWGFGTR